MQPSLKYSFHSVRSCRWLFASGGNQGLRLLRLFDFFNARRSRKAGKSKALATWVAACCMVALIMSCSAPVERPVGPAADYQDAKDMFKRNRFSRTLEFTDGLARSSPPTKFTERAQVLRAVVFAGELKSAKELAGAYEKGSDQTKNTRFKAEYARVRHDQLQYGATAALGLAETAHELAMGGSLPKQVTLETPLPTTEGPLEVKDLQRVEEGGWIEPDQQENAATESLNKGIYDALAAAVSGDRSKARAALASGSAQIDGVDFALFLGNDLAEGAVLFDRKHNRDSQKLRTMCGEADEVTKAALALLKDNPNRNQEKEVKKLQDRCKTLLKNL